MPVGDRVGLAKQERPFPFVSAAFFKDENPLVEKHSNARISARIASVMSVSIARNIEQCNLLTSANMLRFFNSIIRADIRR
jgi:hypothetical protein